MRNLKEEKDNIDMLLKAVDKFGELDEDDTFVYLTYAVKNGTQSSWVKDRLKTKKKKVIICAIMNRLARIAYAMVKNGEVFDETKCNLIKNLR